MGCLRPGGEDYGETREQGHGRDKRFTGTVLGGTGFCEGWWTSHQWACPARPDSGVERTYGKRRSRGTLGVRYYISHLSSLDARRTVGDSGQWDVKNRLHRTLKAQFRRATVACVPRVTLLP